MREVLHTTLQQTSACTNDAPSQTNRHVIDKYQVSNSHYTRPNPSTQLGARPTSLQKGCCSKRPENAITTQPEKARRVLSLATDHSSSESVSVSVSLSDSTSPSVSLPSLLSSSLDLLFGGGTPVLSVRICPVNESVWKSQ